MMLCKDNRLLDAPMRPVTCHRCSAEVEVRKSSWQQTSVQWNPAARESCQERHTAVSRPGPNGDVFEACSALQESIQWAVTAGLIAVPDDGF